MSPKKIAVLGSTGSIGTQTLDVISRHPDLFEAHTLTAGRNAELLIKQARAFKPDTVVIADDTQYNIVQEALSDLPIKVYAGADAISQVVASGDIDVVLTAMVGFSGLRPTVEAIKAGKTIALANKETLVVAGAIINHLALDNHVAILPVDSEHSAILQCIVGESSPIRKILLTASGGPFRTFSKEQLRSVTAAQALKHPNWAMGAKITIDSATYMNKGFEMIEAHWLYGIAPEDIEVVVHPESIVHSAVEFEDGAVKAQLGLPDMRLPIAYALSYPQRIAVSEQRLDLFKLGALHFEPADPDRFPCLRLAYESIARGGNAPCVLNAANEIANLAFREGRIGFADVPRIIEETLAKASFIENPTLNNLFACDAEARSIAQTLF